MKLPVWLNVVILAVAAIRAGGVIVSAISNTRGDYYASLPGAYVRTANPILWDSPDMQGAMGYHLDTYYHGPVQYLTLYPLAFLDSYAQIAGALLPIYAVVIAVAIWCLIAALGRLSPDTAVAVPVIGMSLMFFPLLQASLQREFEVVIFLGLAAALWCLVADRRTPAGALLAYVAWFKYVPLLFLPYFLLRGWLKAAAVFAVTSAGILVAAHAIFDVSLFFNNNVPAHAAQVMRVTSYEFRLDAAGELVGFGFCSGWFASETTLANIRHGLCSLGARYPWLPPNLVYLTICAIVAGLYLAAHRRFERATEVGQERWRRALEFSIVTTICACFFFAHYYYLIVLVIPLSVLLVRYLSRADYARLMAWTVSYVLISAFVIPTGILSRISGTDVWARFIKDGWFLHGELMLIALLINEYTRLSRSPEPAAGR